MDQLYLFVSASRQESRYVDAEVVWATAHTSMLLLSLVKEFLIEVISENKTYFYVWGRYPLRYTILTLSKTSTYPFERDSF